MKKLHILSIAIIATLGSSLLSEQAVAGEKNPHSVGVQLSGAAAKYKGSTQDGDGVGQIYFHYNYSFNNMFSIEAGINSGADADDWKCTDTKKDKYTCAKNDKKLFGLGADELEYTNYIIAAKGQYALTKRNSVYGKVGAQFYDYEISNSDKILQSDDGMGLFLEAGWQYQWDNGLKMNAGVQSIKMDDLKVAGSTIGLAYNF